MSDRAKALIKLAHTGLGCLSIPDLFHLSHDLAKGYSLAIFGRLRQAKRDLEHAKQCLETLQQTPRQSVSASSRYRPGSSLRPRSATGRRWAVPGGSASPICRASCIPGGWRTRPARRQKRWRSSWEPSLRRLKRCLRPTGCR